MFSHDFVILVAAGDVTYNLHIMTSLRQVCVQMSFGPIKLLKYIFCSHKSK